MTGEHSLGGTSDHNKAQELSLFPHQKRLCTEGLHVGPTCLRYRVYVNKTQDLIAQENPRSRNLYKVS